MKVPKANPSVWRYSIKDKLIDAAYFVGKFRQLMQLARRNQDSASISIQTSVGNSEYELLAELFNEYGSDKSTHHDYHLLYSKLLGHRRFSLTLIVEIGIGSINLATPQNMGLHGHPGGSLRAFRDWAPSAEIVGADIDEQTLFHEERIRTCIVNQLKRESFTFVKDCIKEGADLIVIDGLHTPRADINSLLELLPSLRPQGCLVIEDISPRAAFILWPFALLALRQNFTPSIRRMKNGYVFVVISEKLRT